MPLPGHDSTERDEKAHRALLKAQTEVDDLTWLMADKRGRRVMWRLLEESGIYQTSWSADPLLMAFKEGNRNRGLALMERLRKHCPDRFVDMQKEARTHERRNEPRKAS